MTLRLERTAAELKSPVNSARAVGLHYVTDADPGLSRERCGNGFRYRNPAGAVVRHAAVLRRIQSLAIPPAWTDVWICSDPEGHLQATGRDDRRRKQFKYHPRWREIRDETKYAQMVPFAKALTRIRRRMKRDLALPGLPRARVLATVVRLLELSLIRVGNDEYARQNESFGLTTLRDKHVDVDGPRMRFHFRGKGGKCHRVDIPDPRLAAIVRRCQELPGQELFQFIDEDGARQDVRSGDVNDYLREITGADFTAKDFRTWAGTVLAAKALFELGKSATKAEAKRNITSAIESVAARLGNTPAVCRKCYIHPTILDCYREGTLAGTLKRCADKNRARPFRELRPEEIAVLGLLRQRLTLEERLSRSHRTERAGRSRCRRRVSRRRSAPRE